MLGISDLNLLPTKSRRGFFQNGSGGAKITSNFA